MWIERFLEWVHSKAILPEDSLQERLRKRFCITISLLMFLIAPVALLMQQYDRLWVLGVLIVEVSCLFLMIRIFVFELPTSDRVLAAFFWLVFFVTCLNDIDAIGVLTPRPWILQLPLLTAASLLELDYVCSMTLAAIFWQFIVCGEYVSRVGLFDVPTTSSSEYRRSLVECNTLPCRWSLLGALPPLVVACGGIFCHYITIRKYSSEVRSEQAKVKASVVAAHNLAVCLTAFDLVGAEQQLTEAKKDQKLPSELQKAFEHLLNNLKTYRPYLPQSCFLVGEVDDTVEEERELRGSRSVSEEVVPEGSLASREKNEHGTPRARRSSGGSSLRRVRVSFLVLNMRNTLHELEKSAENFSTGHGSVVAEIERASQQHRGVVDLLVGDRVHVTFNAFRSAAAHPLNALEVALHVHREVEWTTNAAVACGSAWCGDLGTAVLRKPMVIGHPPLIASALQISCEQLASNILADAATFNDCDPMLEMKIVSRLVEIRKQSFSERIFAYEVLVRERAKRESNQEWMYVLDTISRWDAYNSAVKRLLHASFSVSDLCPEKDPNLSQEIQELLRMSGGLAPPFIVPL